MTPSKKNSDDKKYFVEYTPASKSLQSKAPLIDKNLNAVLSEANELVVEKQADYLDWLLEDIMSLEETFRQLSTAPDSEQAYRAVFKISHRMMGLGSTFEYPLIINILQNLSKFLEDNDQLNSQSVKVVGLHIDAIKQIITHKLSGNGGEMGKEILRALVKVINR